MVTKASLCVYRTISFHSVSAHGDCIRRTRLSYFLNQVPPITVQKTNVREEDITVRGRNALSASALLRADKMTWPKDSR